MREIIEQAKLPAVLCSFGKDSLLLLDMAREVKPDIDVIHFGAIDKFAEKIIKQWNLTVYSFAPAHRSILINGETTVLVEDYSVGGAYLPVIQDVEPSEVCCGTVNDKPVLIDWEFGWTDLLIGWKATDRHDIFVNQPSIIDGSMLANVKLHVPLANWSDADVYAELEKRGIEAPEPDTDTRKLCTRCLRNETTFCPMVGHEIPPFEWSPADSLAAFQARF